MARQPDVETVFAGSIPVLYDTWMVPMFFDSYASDLAKRLARRGPRRVLELAAGTGVLTQATDRALAAGASITATDLNPAMLERAATRAYGRPIDWRQADAQQLPFADASFDAVICQFGVMFLPDKARAFSEARRVLAPGGVYLFNVWDKLEENEFAQTVHEALAATFPIDPPAFMARIPHGYFHAPVIVSDLAAGGFTSTPVVETVAARSHAASPGIPALALCEGTPLRTVLEARGLGALGTARAAAIEALTRRFGSGPLEGKLQALVVEVERV